ncbi:MAG: MOSC domain-containing protein [Ilumatobacteraceae bacterium]
MCAGRTTTISSGKRSTRTGFLKAPLDGPVAIGRLGIDGDEHVYEDHGGPDMALLVYPHEHYAHWRSLGLTLPDVGAFGENLTVAGLSETAVHLGDVYALGSAVVQVCQPRTPCYKLAIRFGRRDMPVLVQDTGFTGYLLRVREPGTTSAGDRMTLVERGDHGVTVAEAGRVVNVDRNDHEGARRVLAVDALGASVRRTLRQRVAQSEQLGLDLDRLFGDD